MAKVKDPIWDKKDKMEKFLENRKILIKKKKHFKN
jgi:hypothetical protein